MGYYYPDVDFQLDSLLHPRHEDVVKDIRDFLQSYGIEESQDPKSWAISYFITRAYAEFPYSEKLLAVNRLNILWFLIDDLRDQVEPTENGRAFHAEFVALHKDEERPETHPLLRALKDVLTFIRDNADPAWWRIFKDSCVQSVIWTHEMIYDRQLKKPEFETAFMSRMWDGCLIQDYTFHEFLTGQYLPAHIRGNPYYFVMLYYTNAVALLYNDMVGFEKEVPLKNPYLILYALQVEKKLSVQETICQGHRLVVHYFKKFMALYTRLNNHFHGEDLKLMQFVGHHFHRVIQGNKDYHVDVAFRYPRLSLIQAMSEQ